MIVSSDKWLFVVNVETTCAKSESSKIYKLDSAYYNISTLRMY